jgi:ABC-type lipoprotein release transport system permease subunit
MEQKTMRAIFLYIGGFITTLATGCGLLTAAAIGYYLEHATRIELPDVYYVNYLPARLEPLLFVIVGGTVLALGFLATWLPTRNLKNINIIEILRSGQ